MIQRKFEKEQENNIKANKIVNFIKKILTKKGLNNYNVKSVQIFAKTDISEYIRTETNCKILTGYNIIVALAQRIACKCFLAYNGKIEGYAAFISDINALTAL